MRSPAAAALLLVCCLAALTSGSDAWFVAYEESTTIATEAPTTATTAAAPSRVGGKVLEATAEHRRLVEQELTRRATTTTAVPGLAMTSAQPITARPTAVHVTRDHWEELPDWLPKRVKEEFQRDNQEFLLRRLAITGSPAQPITTRPTAVHVTRNYWEELPDWLPKRVKKEFQRDNREFLLRRSATTGGPTATTQPVPEVTLPPWLVKFMDDMISTVSPTPAVTTQKYTPVRPRGRAQESRRLSATEGQMSTLTPQPPPPPPTTTPATAPTRSPLTLDSSERLQQKCSRQVNWSGQPKCSSSRSKWTFNVASLRCEWFAFYGCQLNNGNIFNSRRDCENYCIRGVVNPCQNTKCIPAYTLYQSECFLLNDTVCINSILLQYSNIGSPALRMEMAKEQIQLFCQPPVARCHNTGINARLPSYESPATYDELSVSPPHCHLPPNRGSCKPGQRIRMSRVYYYSQRHNQCKFMMHFGCGGNLNRFPNQAECYNNCGI